ncbi:MULTISPECIES: hypothetical protein [unclassified Devosia]|uniref:hypothetical protein n=1 Tax=unclassified Devosia TaxID=196773 RepID=UPI0012E1125F|nr:MULTISPECIES: hypothetical protein [unclassified Devosia]
MIRHVPMRMSFLNDGLPAKEHKDCPIQQGKRRMLKGQTALIVEAQYLIALDIQATLEDLSSPRVLIAQDPAFIEELAVPFSEIGLAIVEIERNLPSNLQLIGDLVRQGIPVIGVTADQDLRKSINWLSGVPLLFKPTPSESMIDAIRTVIVA